MNTKMHLFGKESLRFFAFFLLIQLGNSINNGVLYPFGYSVDESLNKNNEVSSLEIPLSVPVAYYQNVYSTIYVNDNGLLSFLTEVPSFFNAKFPLSYPIIASMYSNVDTRGSGMVYYRETKEMELLERASNDVYRYFSVGQGFRAQSLFIATWSEVGRFEQMSDLKNTAQVVIASNGTESYCFFLYPENGIQWIQGKSNLNMIQDAMTQAGFMSGDGRYYELPGSGSEQVKNYPKMSNLRQPGMFAFRIGPTGSGNVILPDQNYQESLELNEVETCSNTKFPCVPSADCEAFSSGICCQCKSNYFGNGRSCLLNDEHLRVNGKISGTVNDIELKDKDMYCYVETKEGRVYTGINQVPSSLGYDLQTSLVALGHVVGWLFAVKTNNAPNGFTLTGGVFNRTVDISFPQTGHRAVIMEQYLGLDVFNFLNFKVEIMGTVPTIPSDSTVNMEDFQLEFTKVELGTLKSRLAHSFSFGQHSLNMPIVIEQTIRFEECPHRPFDPQQQTTRLTVERNHIQYDSEHETTRYAFYDSKMSFLSDSNPCMNVQCGPQSTCIVEGNNHRCVCNRGFQQVYQSNDQVGNYNGPMCVDIDECRTRESVCHRYAECINEPGSFRCSCIEGFVGDGNNCESVENECNNIQCSPNAECLVTNRGPRCMCKNGYFGDGIRCELVQNDVEDCRTLKICDLNAECKLNRLIGRYTCVCIGGYRGDGIVCTEESESCEKFNNCGNNAECISDEYSNHAYYCSCNQGYVGDGYTCVAEISSDDCSILNNCHRHSKCIFDNEKSTYECVCDPGFTGNGYKCYNSSYINTCREHGECSTNADCVFDPITGNNVCRCHPGFVGNGLICNPTNECDPEQNECDVNANCNFNPSIMKHECQCKLGFYRNGLRCMVDENVGCNVVNDCDANATCVEDPLTVQYYCKCNAGYDGNGKSCARRLSCDQLNNCDVQAKCIFDETYRCQCSPGFVGDGYFCKPMLSCREDRSVCDTNAECLYSESQKDYSCHCHYGFIGDGYKCAPVPVHDGDFLIFSQGMAILRMPLVNDMDTARGFPLLKQSNQVPVGIDVDCLNGYIFWGDMIRGIIYKAPYNVSEAESILEETTKAPEGLAVDWVSRNIYWTDSAKRSIEVANLDGSLHKVLIDTGLSNPRGIAVHPGSGKLYWTDWNREAPKIEYSNLDGKQRSILVTNDLKLPNNLMIDFEHNDLCWTDAGLNRIECMNLYTKSRRVIYSQASYPFDLTIAKNNIYWTDWETKSVHVIDRNGGVAKQLKIPLGGHGKPFGIVTVPLRCPRISNACSVNNGGCKHLCLPNERGRTCACPDNAYDEDDTCNEI